MSGPIKTAHTLKSGRVHVARFRKSSTTEFVLAAKESSGRIPSLFHPPTHPFNFNSLANARAHSTALRAAWPTWATGGRFASQPGCLCGRAQGLGGIDGDGRATVQEPPGDIHLASVPVAYEEAQAGNQRRGAE